jgi:anti-sigma factor RsiW
MSEHVSEWLGAYADGELAGQRLHQVRAHLASCAACRHELGQIRRLSCLLETTAPTPEPALPTERFLAQVNLRLPQGQQAEAGSGQRALGLGGASAWQRALDLAWRLAPLLLLAGWAFAQAVLAVTGVAVTLLDSGVVAAAWPGLSWLAPRAQAGSDLLQRLLHLGEPLGIILVWDVIISAAVALLCWGWLAGWRARQSSRLLNQT